MKKFVKFLAPLMLVLTCAVFFSACKSAPLPTAENLAKVGIITAVPTVKGQYKDGLKQPYAEDFKYEVTMLWYKSNTESYNLLKAWLTTNGFAEVRAEFVLEGQSMAFYTKKGEIYGVAKWWKEPTGQKIRCDFSKENIVGQL